MSLHFTYQEPNKMSLKQGDILCKSESLCKLLYEVHPHYLSEEYTFFQVITQSCDLERRGKQKNCKSRYITLAAIRSLNDIVNRAIEKYANQKVTIEDVTYCNKDHKRQLEEFVSKIFNNNQTNYFFLEASQSHGLFEHSCTLLHLSISIRAYEHYDLCLESKILELDNNFQAKLGWLVGNLYSRVGTQDYIPGTATNQKDFAKYVEKTLENYVVWIDKKVSSEFFKIAKTTSNIDEIESKVLTHIEQKKNTRLNQLLSLVKKVIEVSAEDEKKLKNIFLQDTVVKKIIS